MAAFEPAIYAERRAVLDERMRDQGVDLLFCPPSGDLEYLTGARRRFPTFGNISYTHGWVCGAFFRPGHDPVFVLPRMVAEFDMPTGVPGEFVVVNETDDGAAAFDRRGRAGSAPLGTIAVEPRTWAETLLALGRAERRQGRQRHLAHQPDAPDQVGRGDRADGGGLPHRRLGDGRRHRRRRRRCRRARARRGGRQPAPPRRVARRVVRHRRVGDGAVHRARRLRPRDQLAGATAAAACRSTSAPSSTATARTSGAPWPSATPPTSTSACTTR